jgi:hypothetical protein
MKLEEFVIIPEHDSTSGRSFDVEPLCVAGMWRHCIIRYDINVNVVGISRKKVSLLDRLLWAYRDTVHKAWLNFGTVLKRDPL